MTWKDELAQVSKKVAKLKAPVPWWEQKRRDYKQRRELKKKVVSPRLVNKWGKRRKVERIAQFGLFGTQKSSGFNLNNRRRLSWVNWFKLPSRRFAVFNSGTA